VTKELGRFGIRCVAVAPGFINIESTHDAVSDDALAHVKQETPKKRLGKANDIAEVVKFAIESDYISGKTLQIDGGLVF